MNLTINASSNARSALSMQVLYARRLLQEAAVALPPAPSPNHPVAAANQRSAANGSSSPSAPSEGISTSPFNVSSQFSPTMVIILVILLSAFFFMGFFAIYVRRCTSDETFTQRGNPRGGTRRHDVPNSGPQRGLGVDASLVESFPMVSYAAAKRKGCNECVVCLADFERGEELKQLPKCKHVFHPGCIGMWLESHTTCPLCRRSLVNSDRWSMSWRWGTGSSRGGSTSARLFDGDSSHLRVGGGDQSGASPSAGSAGSSRGRPTEAEGGETASSGIPGSPLMLPGSAPAVLAHSRSMEIVPGCASCIGSEVAAHRGQVTNTATSRLASEVGAGSRAVWQGGWRRLGRSNSTGHSLRKDVMSRAAAAAVGCVPLRQVSLQRSRSMGLGEEEEEEEEEETAAGVMAERSTRRVSGGGCSSSSGAGPGLGQ